MHTEEYDMTQLIKNNNIGLKKALATQNSNGNPN